MHHSNKNIVQLFMIVRLMSVSPQLDYKFN